ARILTEAKGGALHGIGVMGPRGKTVEGEFGLVPWQGLTPGVRSRLKIPSGKEGALGLVDMASASGLALLSVEERNPWKTTSRGTGELLVAAANKGADLLLLGIGGSGTCDLGLGCLQAMGLRAWSRAGKELKTLTPDQWDAVDQLTFDSLSDFPKIRVACDVVNPLLGERGAVRVYGPQKGLLSRDLEKFESITAKMARRLLQLSGRGAEFLEIPGTGAAGGLGFGLMVVAGAELVPGSDLVSAWLDLPQRVRAADVILTGEGRFDRSSLEGKGPAALVAQALEVGKKVHVFAGSVEPGLKIPVGLSVHAISPPDLPLETALRQTGQFLAQAVSSADLMA
ncbi:MAG: glycerate kinase, partial [Verrucomicrobia bacterium]|nr:glycerate kinase [Verrucomicrobiota bacterium]